MLDLAATFTRWLGTKLAVGVLIVGFALAGFGAWVYLRENVTFDQWRQDTLRAITGERAKLTAALADVHARLEKLSTDIATNQEKIRQADKVIAGLKELQSTWDRLVGNAEQQKQNDLRLASVTAQRQSLVTETEKLREQFTRTTWERDGLQIALGKLDVQIRSVEAKRSKLMHFLEQTWEYEIGRRPLRLPIKGWVALVLGLYFFGPSLGKLVMYYGLASIIVRGKPVRFTATLPALPEVAASSVAAQVDVAAGERLWVKERFLQASDEGLQRKTRYVLDWRIPLTCLATGLIELIEMSNPARAGRGPQRATLSNQADPHSELAIVTLPEGTSLVMRPSFLAGAICRDGERLQIRRRWQLFRWQAWVTLQFRFFEFVGPCRLVVAGSRGVRVENLADRAGAEVPARRTNQDATIAFTPNLDYRPVRAETFWSYYRGMNPLFDDLFAGRGIFLCQQVATEGDAKRARRFWSAIWSGALKIFGL